MNRRFLWASTLWLTVPFGLIIATRAFDSVALAKPAALGWVLVWSDEFAGSALDSNKWNKTMDFPGRQGGRYHNFRYASYVMNDDIIVRGGTLKLRAQRRTIRGTDPPGTFQYSEGFISSHDKLYVAYGYVEMRARFPGGKGMWPAFWMAAQDRVWPPEFDIAEYFGGRQELAMALHYKDLGGSVQSDATKLYGSDPEDAWHTYALEWCPRMATFYFDGVVKKSIRAGYVPGKPMYLILNNGVGSPGSWAGAPDRSTVFPNYFEVNYVRVYTRAGC